MLKQNLANSLFKKFKKLTNDVQVNKLFNDNSPLTRLAGKNERKARGRDVTFETKQLTTALRSITTEYNDKNEATFTKIPSWSRQEQNAYELEVKQTTKSLIESLVWCITCSAVEWSTEANDEMIWIDVIMGRPLFGLEHSVDLMWPWHEVLPWQHHPRGCSGKIPWR